MKKEVVLLCILMFFCVFVDLKPIQLTKGQNDMIHVHVNGAVVKEEDVTVPMYSTIRDVLENVQLSEEADVSTLNPSLIVKDADVINIPYAKSEEETQRISLNTATVTDLQKLSGIGPSLAQRIIDYRNTEGLFQSIEDLMRVKGIGEAKFEKLKDQITL